LDYGDDHLDINSRKENLNLNMRAQLEAKWSFRVGISKIYEGTFEAQLEASKTIFSFKFNNNYSKSTAKISNE
jgi:hypothetical protein